MKSIPCSVIQASVAQGRKMVREYLVNEYAALDKAGVDLCAKERLVIFQDSEGYILAGGHHRFAAFVKNGRKEIPVEWIDLRPGGRRDAILFAIADNDTHGERRSTEDRWNSVYLALSDHEWGKMTNRAVGAMCKVAHSFVATVRARMGELALPASGYRECSDGKTRLLPRIRQKRKKHGGAMFDFKGYGKTLGQIVKGLDAASTAYGQRETESYKRMDAALNEYIRMFNEFQADVKAGKAKPAE